MGRQLASFGDISYKYDENGIRTSKTVNGVTTKFYLDGTNVIEQTDGTTTLHFYYDSTGEILGFEYNGNNYFYIKNAMGDILAIADSNGNVVAEYTYNPWGKLISVTGSNVVLGELNPFRYRSYYYDSDIGMYYLQSRYYDPEICRFINCDDVEYVGITESEISYNPFAYCENDPVNYYDPYGTESYCNISSKYSNDWSYIANKAQQIYKNSKIYKNSTITQSYIDSRGKVRSRKVPLYYVRYTTINKGTGIIYLNYYNRQLDRDKYSVLLGCMTVDAWNVYVTGKHAAALNRIKKRIANELGCDVEKIDTALNKAKDIFEIISTIIDTMGIVSKKVSSVVSVIDIIRKMVKYVKKYYDKQDDYIRNIISGKNSNETFLILLLRKDFRYNSIYYQRGVQWVCETGWHLKKIAKMY